MAEQINLDVNAVLQTMIGQRGVNNQTVVNDFLRLVLNRETFTSADLLEAVQGAIQPIQSQLGAIMAKLDDLGQRIDANTAQATKAFGEIRAALDAALEAQVTPEELQAAVDAAKAAQQADDQAAFDAALDGLAPKLDAQQAALQALDDIVPDAPVEPTEPPVEPAPEPPVEG